MLWVAKKDSYRLKHPMLASLTLAFASFGDAFLYPFLPQNAGLIGMPVIWIGIMLSINRVIRIFFNPVLIPLFARYGVRMLTIVAAGIAILSTLGYGLGGGWLPFLLFRILWGLSFAVLRISSMAYAFENEQLGLSLGLGKSIQDAGPLLALWVGPLLLITFNVWQTFLLLAVLSIPALLFALTLPELKYKPIAATRFRLRFPSITNSITFASSFMVEGILIMVVGVLLATNDKSLTIFEITTLAAAFLAYRRLASLFFAPVGGMIADRLGFQKLFNFSMLLIIVGMLLLMMGWLTVGLIVVFTFHSIHNSMAPAAAALLADDKIKAVTANATWRDLGSASGTILGGCLLTGIFLFEIFAIVIFILTALLFFQFQKTNIS